MSETNGLPTDWKRKKLGDMVNKITVKALPADYPEAKFIGMDCIEPHTLNPSFLYDFKDFKSAGNLFEPRQVLYGRMRPYLNKVYKAQFSGACSGEFIVLDCNYDFSPELLQYILHSREFVRFVNEKTSGDRPRVTYEEISEYPILVPPMEEQERIVAKIEELFSELDAGVEGLKKAQAQLKTYRQSVLKHAFEGRLTNDNIKDGELPAGWKSTIIGGLVERISDGPFGSNLKGADYVSEGVRVIRLENIGYLEFRDELESYVTEEKYETISRYTVGKGDIIFSSFIADEIRVCILPDHIERAINKADCFLIRVDEKKVDRKYLHYFLSSRQNYLQLVDNIHGATRPRINTTQLKTAMVPICSLEEQQRVVAEIESRLSVCDKIEEAIRVGLKQSEALRQSILKKAFEGRLVPQAVVTSP